MATLTGDASLPPLPDPLPLLGGEGDFDLRAVLANSLLEWEDRIAAVAVSGGCPWRCVYCHGWRFVTGLADRPRLPLSMLWETLDRQKGWLDGVVFSGGEPTLQPGLARALEGVKERGLAVKLHSNGCAPGVLRRLLEDGLVDTLALDHKAPRDQRLSRVVGVPLSEKALAAVDESFALAREWGEEPTALGIGHWALGTADGSGDSRLRATGNLGETSGSQSPKPKAQSRAVEYHTTLCPAVLASDDLAEMAEGLAAGSLWFLQNYVPDDVLDPERAGTRAHGRDEMDAMAERLRPRYRGRIILKP